MAVDFSILLSLLFTLLLVRHTHNVMSFYIYNSYRYITAIEDGEYKRDKIDFWDNVYGFNMKCIKDIALNEPLVDIVSAESVISNAKPLLSLDLNTCTVADLTFESDFKLKCNRQVRLS